MSKRRPRLYTTTLALKTTQRLAAWRRVARKVNLTQSEWARSVLDKAAGYTEAMEKRDIARERDLAAEDDAEELRAFRKWKREKNK